MLAQVKKGDLKKNLGEWKNLTGQFWLILKSQFITKKLNREKTFIVVP
jgi:hypothetical protein